MTPSQPPPPPPVVSAPPPPPVISAPPPPPPVATEDDGSESVWGIALRTLGVGVGASLLVSGLLIGFLLLLAGSSSGPSSPQQPQAAPLEQP